MLENKLFEEFFNSLPFKAYIIDTETNNIVYMNNLMKQFINNFPDIDYIKTLSEHNKNCSSCNKNFNNGNISFSCEFFEEFEDKWLVSHNSCISDSKGKIYKYNILVDITEQKENQGKIIQSHAKVTMIAKHLATSNKNLKITRSILQQKSDELAQINENLENLVKEQILKLRKQDQLIFVHQKQASLDNIMSIIAHQWKQPLNELSINNIYLAEKSNKKMKKIYDENNEIIQFLSSTINSFQNFYQNSVDNTFSINKAIDNTLKILNSILRQNDISILMILSEEYLIKGQKNIFSQVILSILENSISIFKERHIKNPEIKIVVNNLNKDFIKIIIEDNAGGVDNGILPFIFEPSKSFKSNPSSGLGLYISKLVIIEKFNGDIKAENTYFGARFIITLPI